MSACIMMWSATWRKIYKSRTSRRRLPPFGSSISLIMDTDSVLSRFVSRRMRRFISTLPTEIRLKSPPKGSRQSFVYRSRRHWKDSSFTFPGKACSVFSERKCAAIIPSSSRFPKPFPSPAAARTVSTSVWAVESSS